MKAKFIFESKLAKLLRVGAITLYPFVFCQYDLGFSIARNIVQHEMVHVHQVRALGWFRFYSTYLLDYFKFRLIYKKSHLEAITHMPFEAEAYAHQRDEWLLDDFAREQAA